MTSEQYSRWVRFALRMAHRGWPRLPRKSRKRVAGMVKDFFRCLDKELVPRIRSWDDTDRCEVCAAALVEARRTQNWRKVNTCPCDRTLVCDVVACLVQDRNPCEYNDDVLDGGYQYRQWDELWGERVRCCIRAGLDLASEPSAGVLGFEICDLRRMYRGNIPAWINDGRWVNDKGEQDYPDLNQGECAVGIWL